MSADGEFRCCRVTRPARVARGRGHRHQPPNGTGGCASHSVTTPWRWAPRPGAPPRAGDPLILQRALPELAPSRAFARRLPGFVGPTPSTNRDERYVTSNLVSAQPSIRSAAAVAGVAIHRRCRGAVRANADCGGARHGLWTGSRLEMAPRRRLAAPVTESVADRPPGRATLGDCLQRHPRMSAAMVSSAALTVHRRQQPVLGAAEP